MTGHAGSYEPEEGAMPEELIRIIFTEDDVLAMAECAGVADAVALERARDWAKHIAATAVELCNQQLASVVECDAP